ncbi:MAG: GGDEF domain-containing protein [Desulfuromonas sp.]|nr:MAG: GGDEF domain-containing protein [Desulfuromonas sp.]
MVENKRHQPVAEEKVWILIDQQRRCRAASPLACDWLAIPAEKLIGDVLPSVLTDLIGSSGTMSAGPLVVNLNPSLCVELTTERLPEGYMLWLTHVSARHESTRPGAPYEIIFEHAAAGLARLALDGSFLDANAEFCRLVGYRREQVLQLSYNDLIMGADEQGLWSDLDRLLSSGENAFSCERTCLCSDYSETWVKLSISLVQDSEDGAFFVLVIKDIERLKDAENEARYLALYDSLTGLPNRRMLNDRIEQAIVHAQREHEGVALFFLDLDRFKEINDIFGHHNGDLLLTEVSKRLSGCVRKIDTVARLGGDEFVVVLQGQVDGTSVGAVAEKILSAFVEPFELDGQFVYSGTSVGVARYPEDGEDRETLLKHADAAMYQAKEEGRGTFRFFSRKLNKAIEERMQFDQSMRVALSEQQFFLEYQPQVELQSGRLLGVEALVRWQHPELGLLMPEHFIPRAEENGTIAALGRWVLEEACKQVAAWRERGCPDLTLTINISGRQFRLSNVADDVDRALELSGLPADCLEIDLAESVLMDRSASNVDGLVDLRARGTRLAIDDFGTGYSSLNYLREFPVDCVKIDRSFVSRFERPGDRAPIAESIISMAHNLGIKVFGEGVQTETQRFFLLARGCDEGQGFYFSYPLSVEAFEYYCFGQSRCSSVGVYFPVATPPREDSPFPLHA